MRQAQAEKATLSNPVVPGGGLAAHEARPGVAGGHTLAEHVGVSDAGLAARLAANRRLAAVSTFADLGTAEQAVAEAFADPTNVADLAQWLASKRPTMRFDFDCGRTVGRVLFRNATGPVDGSRVQIVLQRDPGRSLGFYIRTARIEP